MSFILHTEESAPQKSQPLLTKSIRDFGMIPNLHAVMAQAPAVLHSYQLIHEQFQNNTSFNAEELTVIWLSINVEHQCHYCVPAHTGIAYMMGVDSSIIEALRTGAKLDNSKLQTLRDTALALVRQRGKVDNQTLDVFFQAGYNQRQLLEIILGISQKVLSNYINHLSQTPVDKAFLTYNWQPS